MALDPDQLERLLTATRSGAADEHRRDLVVIGASAGGVEALVTLMAELPEGFPAAVVVVLHLMAGGRSMLSEILNRSGPLPAKQAEDRENLAPGRVFVARVDHHLLVNDGVLRVVRGPRENGHRPAIDPLFRSAATARTTRVIGVIMSGLLDDGAAGLSCVKERGGATVVQDPEDALFPAMPLAAIEATAVDWCVPACGIARALQRLVETPIPWEKSVTDKQQPDRVERDPGGLNLVDGNPTSLSCPACGGAVWESIEGSVVRFTCQVGHAYSAQSMLQEQGSAVEAAMWSALRSLEERSQLLMRISRRQTGASRTRFEHRANEATDHASRIREVLVSSGEVEVAASE
jgi:two-component system chemotaxis response regulator CheB